VDGTIINRDFARPGCRSRSDRATNRHREIEIPTPVEPGRYALKFRSGERGNRLFERCEIADDDRSLW